MIELTPVPVWEPPTGDALIAIAARAARLADEREQACRRYYGSERAAAMGAHDIVSCALTNVVNPVARGQRYGALAALTNDLFRREVDLPDLATAQREIMPEPGSLADLAEDIHKIIIVCEATGRDLGDEGRRVVDGLRAYAELLTRN